MKLGKARALKLALADPPRPKCGTYRGPKVRCELDPGHDGHHFGRGRAGYWYAWPRTPPPQA